MSESEFGNSASMRSGSYIACRCEDISMAEVILALQSGARTLNDVKRRTRAGMGTCQGIYCMAAVAALVAEVTGLPIAQIEPMTLRPPVRLAPLELFAADQQPDAIRFQTREGNTHGEPE